MKLKIKLQRIIITFLAASILGAIIIFSFTFSFFFELPWDFKPYLIISIWALSSLFFFFLTVFSNYYILQKKYVEVHRFKKVLIYNFSDILYIDEEKSLRQKTIYFYTRQGHVRYLTFDKKGLLYKAMLEKCVNRMDKEEFYRKHPDVKI